MSWIVVDASVTLSWCFPDEQTPAAMGVLDLLKAGDQALVPAFWCSEVLNSLLVGEREGRLNEAASAADASRDTIWQGNCDVADLQSRSNIAPIRNTIPIQYPISNRPAKKGFLQTALSKARRTTVFRYTSFVDARFR